MENKVIFSGVQASGFNTRQLYRGAQELGKATARIQLPFQRGGHAFHNGKAGTHNFEGGPLKY